MISKSSVVAILVAAASASTNAGFAGNVGFANKTPLTINYALVGPSGTVQSGAFPPGGSDASYGEFPLPPVGQGYSLKLATGSPQSFSNILQVEYSYNKDSNIFYDLSAVNGPDPFVKYNRTIFPVHTYGPSCSEIRCAPDQSDTTCESTPQGQGPIQVCPAGTAEGTNSLYIQIGGAVVIGPNP